MDLRNRKPAATAIDKTVNVEMTMDNWPHTHLRGQLWARWTGVVRASKEGAYKFCVRTHELNGARLFVDDKPAACESDTRLPTSYREKAYSLPLKAGDHAIMLEFYHGEAQNLWKACILLWRRRANKWPWSPKARCCTGNRTRPTLGRG